MSRRLIGMHEKIQYDVKHSGRSSLRNHLERHKLKETEKGPSTLSNWIRGFNVYESNARKESENGMKILGILCMEIEETTGFIV